MSVQRVSDFYRVQTLLPLFLSNLRKFVICDYNYRLSVPCVFGDYFFALAWYSLDLISHTSHIPPHLVGNSLNDQRSTIFMYTGVVGVANLEILQICNNSTIPKILIILLMELPI